MDQLPGIESLRPWLDSHVPPHLQTRLLWGTLAAVGLTCLAQSLRGTSKHMQSTGFDSFLVAKPARQKPSSKKRQAGANSFNAFLIEDKAVPTTNSFDAFLKDPSGAVAAAEPGETHAAVLVPQDHQIVVTVLFGSEYGFAKEISEKLCSMLTDSGRYWPRLLDMADFPSGLDFTGAQALLVVCSTQGDGVPPSEAREFCDWLNSPAVPPLPHTYYSVCALGDTSYEHFCACGKQLDSRLATLSARQFVPRRDVNREDWKAVNAWLQDVVDSLALLSLQTVADNGGFTSTAATAQTARISKNRPFMGTVVAVEGLCNIKAATDKDTIRVEIDLGNSGLDYTPGDALGIHASNAPEVVEDLLDYLDADPAESHVLPTWLYASSSHPAGSSIPLREMLTRCYDLRVPKLELLQLLWDCFPQANPLKSGGSCAAANGHAEIANGHQAIANGHALNSDLKSIPNGDIYSNGDATPADQRKRLSGLLAASEEEVEKYLEPRHVIDVLSDFSAAMPSLAQLLRTLRPLQPRLYSISSSPLENPCRVQVTVAVVRYTSLRKERLGVASTFLAERIQVGEQLPIYVSKNPDFRLPPNPQTPIVMVGPGTGLSPFRAFVMQRILSGAAFGPSLLYFGCRQRDQDFLYGGLLEEWENSGHISLYTAFSREQVHKVYVQDRLRETGKQVWDLLQRGGHFYVCGDAAHMATAVEEALLDLIAEHQVSGKAAADDYLEELRREDRYQRDVWF